MTKSTKATIAALVGYAIFGFSFLFSKIALEVASPSILLALRFGIAFLALNLLLLTGKQKISLKGKPVGILFVMGLIQPVFSFICEANGIALTTASFSGVIIGLLPVIGVIFGAVFLKEKCTVLQIFCTIFSVVGVALTTTGGFGSFSPLGLFYLLCSTSAAAAFTVISRKISVHFSAFERTYVMFALGATAFTLMALLENRGNPSAWLVPLSQPRFWLPVLYLSLFSSVCAFMLINYTVNFLNAGHALILSNFSTVISVLAGVLILKESFTLQQILGVIIIILSVFGVSWKKDTFSKKVSARNT